MGAQAKYISSTMKGFCILLFLVVPSVLMAQKERIELGKGNEAYRSQDYESATRRFDAALERDGDLSEARFNRANAMVRKSVKMAEEAANAAEGGDLDRSQEIFEQVVGINKKAAEDFESIAKRADSDEHRNRARYNQGNAHLFSGDWDKAIEAYKHALRADPTDELARHNLAFAMRRQQEQQDQQQENQDQDQEQQEQQDQDQQQDQQNQDDQGDDRQQPDEPDQMSPEDAEQLLDAMQQREKELQEELNKRKRKPQVIKIEKDW